MTNVDRSIPQKSFSKKAFFSHRLIVDLHITADADRAEYQFVDDWHSTENNTGPHSDTETKNFDSTQPSAERVTEFMHTNNQRKPENYF